MREVDVVGMSSKTPGGPFFHYCYCTPALHNDTGNMLARWHGYLEAYPDDARLLASQAPSLWQHALGDASRVCTSTLEEEIKRFDFQCCTNLGSRHRCTRIVRASKQLGSPRCVVWCLIAVVCQQAPAGLSLFFDGPGGYCTRAEVPP